jgi:hypothetical protein
VFHWHGLLKPSPTEVGRGPSILLPDGMEEGLPGVPWISGLTKRQMGIYLSLTDAGWDFTVPTMITVHADAVERHREQLRQLHRR